MLQIHVSKMQMFRQGRERLAVFTDHVQYNQNRFHVCFTQPSIILFSSSVVEITFSPPLPIMDGTLKLQGSLNIA